MKKNKKTYLLLGLVLTIWGILGIKIIGALRPTENKQPIAEAVFTEAPPEIQKKDTIVIFGTYRDPFLGTLPKPDKPITQKAAKPKPQLPKKSIVYLGSVAQNGAKNRMFFVTIDGQQHIISKNQEINEVTLLWGNASSIRVKYPGHTQTIALQE